MIVLYCVGGQIIRRNEKTRECTYSVEYSHTTLKEIAEQATYKFGTKGFDCPACKKWGLRVKQVA